MSRTPTKVDDATKEPAGTARNAGLHYVSDQMSGVRRRRAGSGFIYLGPYGRRVTDARVLARIRSLAIPPAWNDVWICPDSLGHVQATGRDAAGRKQYRYHEAWRKVRDATKFDRSVAFGRSLARIRRRTARLLSRPGIDRD